MISGRVWKFPENINTDLILPGSVLFASAEEQMRAAFSANRPGWVDQVRRGDLIVAGANFGMGSSRPAARSLRNLGIACVLADSINGLFFRGCVSYGLLAIECPGVAAAFSEGDVAEVSFDDFSIRRVADGMRLTGQPIPQRLLSMMQAGGIFPLLEKEGLVRLRPAKASAST